MSMFQEDWVPIMLVLGTLFVSGFNFISRTVQYFGIAVASVAQRMSIGLSVPFSIWFYNDPYTALTLLGIVLALASVVLINVPAKQTAVVASTGEQTTLGMDDSTDKKLSKWMFIFPLATFLISVFIEIILQYLHAVHKMKPAIESIVLFATAGALGIVGLIVFRKPLAWRNVVAGIFLGIPNYFSIYFILRALDSWSGSVVYSVNNITVVALSALLGYFFFKERLTPLNILGVALALVASYLLVK